MRKLPKQDLYRVYNAKTKEVHSYGTTLENAKKQITLLNMIDAGVPLKKGGAISQAEKIEIANQIKPITEEEAEKSYLDLADEKTIPPTTSRKGNEFIDYFTFLERLETEGSKGISFWEFWKNKNFYMKKQYVKNLLTYLSKGKKKDLAKDLYTVFGLYFGAPMIFKPVIAMSVYAKYKPTSILDFTMGWGGRLVAAAVLDIPNYIGIDLNKNLEKPYTEMVKKMKELGTTTNIKLMFKDALKVDYSKLDYDMVFTSPPYYNIEIYRGTNRMTEEEWNNEFYRPLFTKTWKHLKNGGHYIINVPSSVYENVLIDLFGKADTLIPLGNKRPMAKKLKQAVYTEYMYVWKKTSNSNIQMKGKGVETDLFDNDKLGKPVSIPEINSIDVILPTYMYKRLPDIKKKDGTMKPPQYRFRLVTPTTKARNLASRMRQNVVNLERKPVASPSADIEPQILGELPKLKEFSPADRKKIEEYYKQVKAEEKKDKKDIPNQPTNNRQRGFPLPCDKQSDGVSPRPKKVKAPKEPKPVGRPKADKITTEKKPRGRPKKQPKKIQIINPEVVLEEGDVVFPDGSSISELSSLAKDKTISSSSKSSKSKSSKSSASSIDTDNISLDDADVEDFLTKYGIKKGKGIENKISTKSIGMNSWIQHTKQFAAKKGIKYNEALKDPENKASYKKGAGVCMGCPKGYKCGGGIIDEAAAAGYADQVLIADAYNQKNLGAQKRYISL